MTMNSRPRVLTETDAGTMDTLLKRTDTAATQAEARVKELGTAIAGVPGQVSAATAPAVAAAQQAAALAAQRSGVLGGVASEADLAGKQAGDWRIGMQIVSWSGSAVTARTPILEAAGAADVAAVIDPTPVASEAALAGTAAGQYLLASTGERVAWSGTAITGRGTMTATAPQVEAVRQVAAAAVPTVARASLAAYNGAAPTISVPGALGAWLYALDTSGLPADGAQIVQTASGRYRAVSDVQEVGVDQIRDATGGNDQTAMQRAAGTFRAARMGSREYKLTPTNGGNDNAAIGIQRGQVLTGTGPTTTFLNGYDLGATDAMFKFTGGSFKNDLAETVLSGFYALGPGGPPGSRKGTGISVNSNGLSVRDAVFRRFKVGADFDGFNTFINNFTNTSFTECDIIARSDYYATNSGEMILYVNCYFSNSDIGYYLGTDYFSYVKIGGSSDYNHSLFYYKSDLPRVLTRSIGEHWENSSDIHSDGTPDYLVRGAPGVKHAGRHVAVAPVIVLPVSRFFHPDLDYGEIVITSGDTNPTANGSFNHFTGGHTPKKPSVATIDGNNNLVWAPPGPYQIQDGVEFCNPYMTTMTVPMEVHIPAGHGNVIVQPTLIFGSESVMGEVKLPAFTAGGDALPGSTTIPYLFRIPGGVRCRVQIVGAEVPPVQVLLIG